MLCNTKQSKALWELHGVTMAQASMPFVVWTIRKKEMLSF